MLGLWFWLVQSLNFLSSAIFRSNCRSCDSFEVKGNLNRHKGVQRSSLMASRSYASKESKLDNEDSIKKEKLLVDCEEDQECVVGRFFWLIVVLL